jgi:hypothetical protein
MLKNESYDADEILRDVDDESDMFLDESDDENNEELDFNEGNYLKEDFSDMRNGSGSI